MSANPLLYLFPLAFGFLHGVIFAVILVIRGVNQERQSDYLLATLLLSGCLLILPTMLGMVDIHVLWNEWLFLPLDPALLLGPIVYLFVLAHTNRSFKLKVRHLVHAIPFGIYAIYHIVVFAQGADFVFRWMDSVDLPYVEPVYQIATLGSMAAYLVVTVRHYAMYRKWVEEEYANPDPLRFRWITGMLCAVGLAILATCVFRFTETLRLDFDFIQAWWTAGIVTVSLYYVSISGYSASRPPMAVRLGAPAADPGGPALSDSGDQLERFSPEQLDEWVGRISRYMRDHKPFLKPDLGLGDMAKALGSSRNVVSAAINAGYGKNFRRLVNEYRVEAFKRSVAAGLAEEMTLFGLALDCGFNSKATFNRVFKQIEGRTPNQFVGDLRHDAAEGDRTRANTAG